MGWKKKPLPPKKLTATNAVKLAEIAGEQKKIMEPPKLNRHYNTKVDWVNLKEEWIVSNLKREPLSLEALAEKYNVSRYTVYGRSSQDKWAADLAFRISNRDAIVAEALETRSKEAIMELQKDFIANEVEVRRRHHLMAKTIQAKAVKRLQTIPIDQLKPADAIAMLRLGFDEERRALGLPDVFDASQRSHTDDLLDDAYRPLAAQMKNHKRTQQMGIELLKRIKAIGGESVSDAQILDEVGLGPNTPGGPLPPESDGRTAR